MLVVSHLPFHQVASDRSTFCPICLPCVAFPATFDPTMARNSLPRRSVNGSLRSVPKHMPGSPWENGYCESFNSKLRDELLNGEIFYTLKEAQIVIENWRQHHNTIRPHSSLSYRPPTPKAIAWPAAQKGPASPATPTVAPRPNMH